ncbi:hypothetical protein HMPREF3038_03235 [Akkermansia sp. KLE1797]|nr:hypothetical protein HMPREF3038_03235 [Akkermansia sp. KLE1797]KXU55151.1 hypothetical protein HMPREF3039_00704 [Akkermansia sp. KLE1798]KZA06104.1 hypothetical protein HMPREF1326_00143 [Akkermansia sp. KLE1605]
MAGGGFFVMTEERFSQADQGVDGFFQLDGEGKHGMLRAAWQKYP